MALENKIVEWDESSDIQQMWKKVTQITVYSAKENWLCKYEEKYPKKRAEE